jgi:hypothetical protein
MIPRFFHGKNIPFTNGTELRHTVDKMCAEYFSGIPEKRKKIENKEIDLKKGEKGESNFTLFTYRGFLFRS